MRNRKICYGIAFLCCCFIAFGQAMKSEAASTSIISRQAVAGLPLSLNTYYDNTGETNSNTSSDVNKALDTFLTKTEKAAEEKKAAEEAKKYENIGIAKVDRYLNIRKEPSSDGRIVGKLPNHGGCYIYSIKDGWAKIKSGSIKGYVSAEYLITGEKVPALAKKVGRLVATVCEDSTNVRKAANTDCKILTSVPKGTELEVVNNSDKTWVKVTIDNEVGYVHRDLVNVNYQLKKAISNSESSGSSIRSQMVAYAKKFLGNRYVYGGTSLNNGIDCSAFTMKIYQKFGYHITRTSRSQAATGRPIDVHDLKPGDLVFYAKRGYIYHVAMYIGGGKVIHASSPSTGIIISKLSYRSICKAVRFIND